MHNIDLKDRKILYELDLNCRQSNSQIGKKVGLGRDVVAYRINRMQEEGIIKNFWTAINTFKLGYNVFRVYINLRYVSSDKKNEIIQYFVDCKNTWAVISIKGEIDLDTIFWVEDIYDFYIFWEKTIQKYGEFFEDSAISIFIYANSYKKSYLMPELSKSDRLLYKITCKSSTIKLDRMDHRLLNELASDARIPLIELADKLGVSSQTINYRIKNLLKEAVIQAFRVNIDISKLNLEKFLLNIYLQEPRDKNALINYLESLPCIEYIDVGLGWSDLLLEVILENVDDLTNLMDKIASKFPNSIKKQNIMIATQYHKERWLPKFEENKSV